MKNITPKKFGFSREEKKHILKAWIAISIAFSIAIRPFEYLTLSLLTSSITIGFAFLLHELAHKYLAIKYRCYAEFRANNNMLIFMLIMSIFGFIFAAPGAVQISGNVTKDKYGKIALVGPLTNILLAIFIFPFLFLNMGNILSVIFSFGFMINSWLALFNMLPILGFDGHKIFHWNKKVFYCMLGASIFLLVLMQVFNL